MPSHTRWMITLLGLVIVASLPAGAQTILASKLWLRVWGDSGASAAMIFGNSEVNTGSFDSTAPGEYEEIEPPPAPPGLDCIWVPPLDDRRWGEIRGLFQRDWRAMQSGSLYENRIDTFVIRFVQNNNSSATISMRWPDAAYLQAHCDSIILVDVSGVLGFPANRLDMTSTDTLVIPAAGDNFVSAFRLIKYGARALVDDVDATVESPRGFSLSPNYPNPFNPATTIDVQAPVRGTVALRIYDVLGREVTTLYEGTLEPGSREFTWEAGNASGGVYYCRLSAGGRTQTRAMLLLR